MNYASNTDIIPVKNIASNVPASPIEINGTPRSGIFFRLSMSMPRIPPNVPEMPGDLMNNYRNEKNSG